MNKTEEVLKTLDKAKNQFDRAVSRYKYSSLTEYFQFLNYSFEKTTNFLPGRFYTYCYHFDFWKYGWENVKFYDFYPFVFCFDVNLEQKYATCLNFHHIPVIPRKIWLNRVLKLGASIGSGVKIVQFGGRKIYKIGGLNYPKVYKILRKTKMAIRRYNFRKMKDIKAIPLNRVEECMEYYAKTWFGSNINQIWRRYHDYNPYYKNI